MYISICIYIYIYISSLQRSTEVPLGRSALSVRPCGDPWGTLLHLVRRYSRAPTKPPRGQTLRSPRPKLT